jgi:hypothetical protein
VRRTLAAAFAGERAVWRAAAICAVPLALLIAYYCLRPRHYDTGSNNVEVYSYVVGTAPGRELCVPGLHVPKGTSRVRLQVQSPTRLRPRLDLALQLGPRLLRSELAPAEVTRGDRVSAAIFTFAARPTTAASQPASLCVASSGTLNWGGTPLPAPPASAPTLGGTPVAARIAIWYQPPAGSQASYLSRLSSIAERAALFRPAPVGPWTYYVILFLALPVLALLAVRLLALAAAGRPPRRVLVWLYAIAVANFLVWALITPPFQAPDEVDHFAYTQSLVERGERPTRDPTSPQPRWSAAENLALEDSSFFTDHQVGDSTVPWQKAEEREYERAAAALHPSASSGGGNETAASHGPIYYAALAPAYALAGDSPFSQLALMRIFSALIGALAVVFTYLLARELVPGRAWPAMLAALLVAFQPMYGFISGAVNNDVGVNAGAAALALLMIRVLRRGITVPSGVLIAALAVLLPQVKGTILSLYPLLAVVLAIAIWRQHSPAALRAWAATAATAAGVALLSALALSGVSPAEASHGVLGASSGGVAGASSVSLALHHLPSFVSYLWQVFLPRLGFMHAHFHPGDYPAYTIFVQRGWAAFGWYDVLFPAGVYTAVLVAMLAAIPLGIWAARRERGWLRANWIPAGAVLAMPVLVLLGVEAAFYTPSIRPAIAEFGRYMFPAIAPLAVIAVGVLHAFGRRGALLAGAALLAATLALTISSQLLTLTTFYA